MNLSSYLPGQDRPRDIRRVVVRWFCLAKVLALRMVSHKVKKRFPSYQDIVTHGLMTATQWGQVGLIPLLFSTGKVG